MTTSHPLGGAGPGAAPRLPDRDRRRGARPRGQVIHACEEAARVTIAAAGKVMREVDTE